MINPNLASRPGSSVSWIGDGNALNDEKDSVKSNMKIRGSIRLICKNLPFLVLELV